jgi:predicted GTPase
MPEHDALKNLARAISRIEELLDRLPLDAAKEVRARIATLRTVLLDKRPPALVLVGRRGAGKSSLVNALFGAKVAELGHVTAQTGRGRWYTYEREGGALSILDTRGLQEASAPAEQDAAHTALESIAVELRTQAPDVVVFVAKASEVDAAVDADLDALEHVYDEIRRAHRSEPPLVAVVTHCDLVEPKATRLHASDGEQPTDVEEKRRHVALAEHALGRRIDGRDKLRPRHVATVGVSSYMSWRPDGSLRGDERWGIDGLASTLFRHVPDAGRAELARVTRVRVVQEDLATTLTQATAAICAGIAAVPFLPAAVLPLTALQASMVAGIAWIGGRSVDRRSTTEFVSGLSANVGMAFGLRLAARALMNLVSPAGAAVVSAGVAFTGTMAVGAAAKAYYIRGVSFEDAKRIFRREKPKKQPEEQEQQKP